MRALSSGRFFVLVSVLVVVAAFASGRAGTPTYADGTAVAAGNSPNYYVAGLFSNSYASLTQSISASDTSFNVTDPTVTQVGFTAGTTSFTADVSFTADAAVTTTNTTLTDTRQTWAVNQWVGQTVTSNSKTMVVTSNTATTLTGTAGWSGGGNPGNGNAYSITAVTTTNTTLTDASRTWAVNQWVGQAVISNGKTMVVTSNTATTLTGAGWSGGGNPGNRQAYVISPVSTTNTTLTDTRQTWTTNGLVGRTVQSVGKTMVVTSNTATTLTGVAWSGGGNPGNGNGYLISDQGCLRVGWTIQVQDSIISQPEWMLITQLITGTSGNPDTVVVTRGQGGTTASPHAAGVKVQTRAISIDIMAQNVSVPTYGFGAFNVQIAVPSQLQILEFNYDTTWLGSTGRIPSCDPPIQKSPGVWQTDCASLNNPSYGQPSWYPPGPNGTGRIARLTVLPPTSLGSWAIQFAGSYLLSVPGSDLSAAALAVSVQVVNCPDTNFDGFINSTDLFNIARNLGDQGADSGATLVNTITSKQTQIAISNQSLLSSVAPNNIISIDDEEMTVVSLVDGSPDTMTVTRATYYPSTAASHKSGAHIYRDTGDAIPGDGIRGYTPARDAVMDGFLNSTDLSRVAKMMAVTPACPVPP